MISKKVIAVIAALGYMSPSLAEDEQTNNQTSDPQAGIHSQAEREMLAISNGLQNLKREIVDLNKSLSILEDQLLFPTGSQFSAFVTVTSGQFFQLESVRVKINDQLVASHTYSDQERDALKRGGVQRLFETNLLDGSHEVTALFTGIGPGGVAYKRAISQQIEKDNARQFIEIAIGDSEKKQEPDFTINLW